MTTGAHSPSTLIDWGALSDAFQQSARAGELDEFRRRRWQIADDPAAWLEQDTLATLTQTQADSLYRAAGGRQITKFRGNPLEEIRDSVDFLLYDTIKLETASRNAPWKPAVSACSAPAASGHRTC